MAITHWPADERPREKLIAHGAGVLSDAELLAIFLRTGIVGMSAVDLARQMLTHFGSLSALVAAPLSDFSGIKGMGDAKFAQLQATVELARRALGEQLKAQPVFNQPTVLIDFLRLQLGHLPYEAFHVLLLGTDLALIKTVELFRGSVSKSYVFPRELAKLALTHNAGAVVVAHNHPHGDASPSSADIALTNVLKQSLNLIDVQLLDHIIVSKGSSQSFAQLGLL